MAAAPTPNSPAAPWALITGASSGFGADFARELAGQKHDLVLVARRTEPMEALARELEERHRIRTRVIGMDLARPGVGAQLKAQLDAEDIAVDVLINNAGYGVYGELVEQSLARTLDMLQLNVVGLTELTHVFGADMARRGRGQILLVASIGGYQATPTYAAYSASKAYVLLFGEALHEELKKRGVTVTVVSPGVAATSFFAVSGQKPTRYQRLLMMRSQDVVRVGLSAMRRGRASIVPGFLNALTVWLNRLFPRSTQRKTAYSLMRSS